LTKRKENAAGGRKNKAAATLRWGKQKEKMSKGGCPPVNNPIGGKKKKNREPENQTKNESETRNSFGVEGVVGRG